MVCFDLFGMSLAVDFTAPALLALLSLLLPPDAILQTVSAGVLHECAHLLMIAATGQKPALLRLSAAGLRLETAGTAVIPLRRFAWILLAGPLSNLLAAILFGACGMQETAAAHGALCLFNLLPYRSTDGGTLLLALLEERMLPTVPERPALILRITALLTTVLLFAAMYFLHLQSWSLAGMLIFMLLSEI